MDKMTFDESAPLPEDRERAIKEEFGERAKKAPLPYKPNRKQRRAQAAFKRKIGAK
jgi:hypothetical protein